MTNFIVCGPECRIKDSIPHGCSYCQTEIFISPSTRETAPQDAKPICVSCAACYVRLNPSGVQIIPLHEKQIKELADYFKEHS